MSASKNDIQRLIECCICCDYLTDIRETPCCHQLFCLKCIQSWLEKPTQACPKCRSNDLTVDNLLKNVVIQRFVDNLQFDCPNMLHGCQIKVLRCDLDKHKRACLYSIDKRVQKQKFQLEDSRSTFEKYKQGKMHLTENILFDLAKYFHTEHENQLAYECLQSIKDKCQTIDYLILQGEVQRDLNQTTQAIESLDKALVLTKSLAQQIQLLISKGHLLIKLAQYEQATNIFNQALSLINTNQQSQTKAEILNAQGLIAKKCSNVRHEKHIYFCDCLFFFKV